jgi:hypothetical protein
MTKKKQQIFSKNACFGDKTKWPNGQKLTELDFFPKMIKINFQGEPFL